MKELGPDHPVQINLGSEAEEQDLSSNRWQRPGLPLATSPDGGEVSWYVRLRVRVVRVTVVSPGFS